MLVRAFSPISHYRLHRRGQDSVRIAGGYPDAHRAHVDTEPSAAAKSQALQKTVDWLRKDLKAEGSDLKVSDVPATLKELSR